MLFHLKNFLLDLIFPVRCIACKREGELLCSNCVEKIELNKKQFCPICRRESFGGRTCVNCAKECPLTGLLVAASYEKNPGLAQAVKTLKYKFSKNLAKNLSTILVNVIAKNSFDKAVLVPVPLHKKRQRWRGFNQANLLAEAISFKITLPIENLLMRTRNTPQQAKLNRQARLKNLSSAFELNPGYSLKNKTVILVDDVASTGTTLIECAKVLKKGGAGEVWGLVLARG